MPNKVFLAIFDAKMKTYVNRKDYARFLKKLKGEGFLLLQKSVYIKHSISYETIEGLSAKIKKILPVSVGLILLAIPIEIVKNGEYCNCLKPNLIENKTIICV